MSGKHTGKEIDKISLFKEVGIVTFYHAMRIGVLMIRDAAMNAECELMMQEELEDYIMFVEVAEISADDIST